MASIRVVKTTKEFEEYARQAAREANGSLIDAGSTWSIKASPRLVLKRSTMNKFFQDRPKWERNALWESLPSVTEGVVTKQTEEELILED
jgi:hypothetical protein